jgi:hypothetical protein
MSLNIGFSQHSIKAVNKLLTATHDTSLYEGRNTYMYQRRMKINLESKTNISIK